MSKYVIVAESGSDISPDVAKRYGIEVIPMYVTFGGECYDDGSIPPAKLFEHYRNTGELPSTSACTPQDFAMLFDRIHSENPQAQIIYLAYSAITTCTFESALTAAKGRDYVTAIDTKSVSAGQGLVVTSTARFLQENPDADLAEVEAYVADLVKRARMIFIPGGLDFLHAGGRLSNGAYLGAQLLRIKPVIEIVDGKLVATKKLRGTMDKAVAKALDAFLTEEAKSCGRVVLIRNEGLSEEIQAYAVERMKAAGFEEIEWVETGCVISSHCGPGSFGVACFAAE